MLPSTPPSSPTQSVSPYIQSEGGAVGLSLRISSVIDSLALRAVAVHAVLDGLVADLPDGAARHVHGQARLRAPLDAPP